MTTEIIITALGLVQGVLALLDRRSNWIVYAVQMAALVIFSYHARLYGDMVQSAVYMFICLYSFRAWKEGTSSAPTHISLTAGTSIGFATIISTIVIGYVLSKTDDPLPYVDAFTTVTTVVALLMMSAHKIECWLVWLVNDLAYMYQYFNLPDQALYLFGLYCIWTLMAVGSYVNWNRISRLGRPAAVIFLFLLSTLFSRSQDNNSIWLERSKDRTLLVGEFKDPHDRSYNYLYVESDLDFHKTGSTYVLASTDRKWWDAGIWVHGELRTFLTNDFSADNVYLIGPNFDVISGKAGFLNIQTMYRYDGRSNFQVSVLADLEYRFIYYTMFADTYGPDRLYVHSENRLFFRIFKPVRIGTNLLVTVNEEEKGIRLTPMAVLRVDL